MDTKGYYKSLGVNENASDDEIKKAFRKLSIKYHPDKQAGKSEVEKKEAEDKFKEINEAYQILSDPEKKKNYDQFGSVDGNGGFSGDPFGAADMSGMFTDMFNSFFNGNSGYHKSTRTTIPGSDIRMTVPLTLKEVYEGCTKKLKFTRKVRCANCHGEGGSGKKVCPTCGGTGYKRYRQTTPMGFVDNMVPCETCHQEGSVCSSKCPTCDGFGFTTKEEIIEINFPAGMAEGFAIEKTNMGNESKSTKMQNGSFYAIASYSFDHNIYMVQGYDIRQRITIPYYDILLGTDYILTLPDDTKVKVTIPSCIEDGSVLRIPGKGIKTVRGTGDYYIEVYHTMPNSISDEEKENLQKIKDLHV